MKMEHLGGGVDGLVEDKVLEEEVEELVPQRRTRRRRVVHQNHCSPSTLTASVRGKMKAGLADVRLWFEVYWPGFSNDRIAHGNLEPDPERCRQLATGAA